MGIYIKGMEMPKGNDAVSIIIFPNGKVSLAHDRRFAEYAEAVHVPPHGDLIDRKDAYDSLLNGMVMTGYQSRALDCIAEWSVPAVIPASDD